MPGTLDRLQDRGEVNIRGSQTANMLEDTTGVFKCEIRSELESIRRQWSVSR
jgi:hypothetical protein